jgi:ariadne-1
MFLLKYILSWFLNMGEQSEDLQKVVDFLAIRLRHARTLLIHHRWNVESLFGKLAETGTNEIFLEAGLPPPEDLCSRPQVCEPSFISCGICLDDAPQKEATRMDCGHAFCNDCKHTCSLDSSTIVSIHHQCLIKLCFNLLS